jgi:hypothetical protein
MVGLLRTKDQRNSVWATVLHAAFLLLLVSVGFVDSATGGVLPQNSPELSVSYAPQFAIADFDGDNRPDLTSVEFGRSGPQNYAINFRLTSGPRQSIDIAAPEGGLRLRAQDVNGDSFPDVVVTTFWTGRPVAILLNDGRGNFTRSEPSAFPGAFEKPENLLTSANDNKVDTVAALLSRYSPEPREENAGAASLLTVVGRSVGESFHILASLTGNSSLGRAPPSVAVHS